MSTPNDSSTAITTNKAMIGSFVNSVANMEEQHYTLDEAAIKLRKEAEESEKQCSFKLNHANEHLSRMKEYYQRTESQKESINTYRKYKKREHSVGSFIWQIVAFIFIYALVGVVPSLLLSATFELIFFGRSFANFHGTFVIPILIITIIAYIVIARSINKKDYAVTFKKAEDEFFKAKTALDEAIINQKNAQKEFDTSKITNEKRLQQAEEMEHASYEIQQNITTCYNLGVIQPAYRNLLCVSILNDIFINDKADTMREAMLLCDLELKHITYVDLLKDIRQSIKQLAESIECINTMMKRVDTNVSFISQDIANIANSQEKIAYATESIKQSADNTDFYIAQRRSGAI